MDSTTLKRLCAQSLLMVLASGCSEKSDGENFEGLFEELAESFDADIYVHAFEQTAIRRDRECGCHQYPDGHYNADGLLKLAEVDGLVFDEECALANLQHIETVSCHSTTPQSAPACKLMHGAATQGQPCTIEIDSIDDCAQGLRCQWDGAPSVDQIRHHGACRGIGTEVCFFDEECPTGWCHDGSCRNLSEAAELGAPCGDDGLHCGPGLVCDAGPDRCISVEQVACSALPNTCWASSETGHVCG